MAWPSSSRHARLKAAVFRSNHVFNTVEWMTGGMTGETQVSGRDLTRTSPQGPKPTRPQPRPRSLPRLNSNSCLSTGAAREGCPGVQDHLPQPPGSALGHPPGEEGGGPEGQPHEGEEGALGHPPGEEGGGPEGQPLEGEEGALGHPPAGNRGLGGGLEQGTRLRGGGTGESRGVGGRGRG